MSAPGALAVPAAVYNALASATAGRAEHAQLPLAKLIDMSSYIDARKLRSARASKRPAPATTYLVS